MTKTTLNTIATLDEQATIKIVKRDGVIDNFDAKKIFNAVYLAAQRCERNSDYDAHNIADQVMTKVASKLLASGKETSVEGVQDCVEKTLMQSKNKDVAREYIEYRYNRDVAREAKTKDMFLEIIGAEANDVTRENANMNADTPAGMMMKFASETTKPFVDNFLLSPETKRAIDEVHIYPHDKDYYPTKSLTCLHHPLDKILQEGFRAGHGASRPAKRIETASILGCISMETVQNEMHGGQAIPAFDFYLAPYVRATYIEEIKKVETLLNEDLSVYYNAVIEDFLQKEVTSLSGVAKYLQVSMNNTVQRVHQSMEAFIHNMNTIHSRGGNQVVFSSLNYGTDTSPEGRCIIRELLLSTFDGVGNNETAIFPIQIWKKKRGTNYLPEDPNYDLYKLACEVTAKRFFPNFINLDATFNQHEKWNINDPKRYVYECATMGCRTRVFENRHGEKTSIGRGNLSFTTINLPRLAIESAQEAQATLGLSFDLGRGSEEFMTEEYKTLVEKLFLEKVTENSDICDRQLFDRFEFQSTAYAKQFPLLMQGLWAGSEKLAPDDTVGGVLKQGSLSIGFIGLAEALTVLTGKHHGESDYSQQLGIKTISMMQELCNGYSEARDLNYSVIGTPAEGLSGRFTGFDKKAFGVIAGVTDRDYYTNSNHVPVWYKCTSEHKAKIEGRYHELTTAGHIFYTELDGDATHNPESISTIVDLMDKYNLGYGSVNHTRSRCLDCGFENSDEELTVCPKCGSEKIDTIQRITGYLVGTTDRWNAGKKAELKDRVTHTGKF